MDELLDSISYDELVQWGAYYQAEPWGEWRADVRSAQVVATLANINRDPKKRPEPYTIKEMMLFKPQNDEAQEQTIEQTGAKTDPAVIAWFFHKSGARIKG